MSPRELELELRVLGQLPEMEIGEACEVLEVTRARAGINMLDLLAAMRDYPACYTSRERAAWRVFMRDGYSMFAPAA